MKLIRITGPREPMRLLGEVKGLDFERTSARQLEDDHWQVSGYASDEALADLQARGLGIEAVVEAETLQEQRRTLFAQIQRDEDDA